LRQEVIRRAEPYAWASDLSDESSVIAKEALLIKQSCQSLFYRQFFYDGRAQESLAKGPLRVGIDQ